MAMDRLTANAMRVVFAEQELAVVTEQRIGLREMNIVLQDQARKIHYLKNNLYFTAVYSCVLEARAMGRATVDISDEILCRVPASLHIYRELRAHHKADVIKSLCADGYWVLDWPNDYGTYVVYTHARRHYFCNFVNSPEYTSYPPTDYESDDPEATESEDEHEDAH